MRAVIVDDERLARNELRRLVDAVGGVEVVGEARTCAEAIEVIERLRPALVLLDVQLPDGDGFSVLEQLTAAPFVVFTTAYDQYAVRAFEVSALDYLLKPIVPERLAAALAKAAAWQHAATAAPDGPSAPNAPEARDTRDTRDARDERDARDTRDARDPHDAQETSAPSPMMLRRGERIFVRDGDRCWFVPIEQIVVIEAEGNFARLSFGAEHALVPRSLNAIAERLDPAMFFRANRQQIVNLDFIESLVPWPNDGYLVKLSGGRQVEMSRRQARLFQAAKRF